MKFINKKSILSAAIVCCMAVATGCTQQEQHIVTEYEVEQYNRSLSEGRLFATNLCVAKENVAPEKHPESTQIHAAGLFGLDQQQVFYSSQIHDRFSPASTTKLMTLHLALKHGSLDDVVTVSKNAVSVPSDSSVAGLREGDKLTLKDLLYALMLPSGNDSAVAIGEHIAGSEEGFVKMMNEEAYEIGATNSHFMNPHGYHDDNHYTTAYDLYLITNQMIDNQTFLDIVSTPSYTTNIESADGSVKSVTWRQTNMYVKGTRTAPEQVTVIGGKTGSTDQAGACLVLLSRDATARPYISIVMGAKSKAALYDTMTAILTEIPTLPAA